MTRTTFKKVPFDIELAKKITNKEVKGRIVAENGFTAKIICFDYKMKGKRCNIVALIEFAEYEDIITCGYDGKYNRDYFNRELALHIELPTYHKDYSNFVPCKLQPCLVRNGLEEQWNVRVCAGVNKYNDVIFYRFGGGACTWEHVLPLSKVTERLIDTTKSYEELIKQLDAESTATTKNKQQ